MTKNLVSLDGSRMNECLNKKSLKIGVIGIGRIGLPTALCFANAGFQTIGIDINEKLVDMIKSGDYPLKDEPEFDKIFESVLSQKTFSATTNISEAIPNCDIILLSLPTPMDDENIPDYNALLTVGRTLNGLLSNGQIVIVESTVEPGFIENELLKTIEGTEKTLTSGNDFHLAVCPETANPGEIMNDFQKLPRLVGAIDEKVSPIVSSLYTNVFGVELILMPNCKTANAVKLTTNVFRDINIAFVNELALMFEKLGIDTMNVLEAAKAKYNFQVHYPGAGVGGPCLPINSYQLLNAGRRTGVNLNLIEQGRKINEKMPEHVIQLTLDAFKEANELIQGSDILILGVSYKPDVKDIQLTPAKHVIEKLQSLGAKIHIYDPYFTGNEIFGIKVQENLDQIIEKVNASIIITAHKEFQKIELTFFKKMKTSILIDTRGIVESASASQAKLIFRGLGRGNN